MLVGFTSRHPPLMHHRTLHCSFPLPPSRLPRRGCVISCYVWSILYWSAIYLDAYFGLPQVPCLYIGVNTSVANPYPPSFVLEAGQAFPCWCLVAPPPPSG